MVPGTIAVLGGGGFLGGNLCRDLGGVAITRANYAEHAGRRFDVLINANGNSKKPLPESDPLADFDLTVRTTLKSTLDFRCRCYVYLSSCEVYGDLTSWDGTSEQAVVDVMRVSKYGLSKYLAECLVKRHCERWLILRLNGPVGPNMSKGPVYDILKGERLWVSADSELQLIHTSVVARFLAALLAKDLSHETINLAGNSPVSLRRAMAVLGREVSAPVSPAVLHNINNAKANALMPLPGSAEALSLPCSGT